MHPLDTDSFEGSQDGATQSTTNAPQVAATEPIPTHPMMTWGKSGIFKPKIY